jgi:hypothetical protein
MEEALRRIIFEIKDILKEIDEDGTYHPLLEEISEYLEEMQEVIENYEEDLQDEDSDDY